MTNPPLSEPAPAPTASRLRRPWLLPAVTLVVLIAVFTAPYTGWLARLQLRAMIHGGDVADCVKADRLPASVQNDFHVRLAEACGTEDGTVDVARNPITVRRIAALRKLALAYPDQPAVYGCIVTYTLRGTVYCSRVDEEQVLEYPPARAYSKSDNPTPTPVPVLEAYDTDCAAGERVDPDNAYFPACRAYGLFAQHRDNDAIAELIAAGKKPYYREYLIAKFDGNYKLLREEVGGDDWFLRSPVAYWMTNVHRAALRDLDRIATSIAVREEMEGMTEHGLEIRCALRRLGGLIRWDSRNAMGNIFGVSLVRTACDKPRGAVPADYEKLDQASRTNERVKEYIQYLRQTGHFGEATAYVREDAAGIALEALYRSMASGGRPFFGPIGVLAGWVICRALICCALLLALLGVISVMLARTTAVRTGSGLFARQGSESRLNKRNVQRGLAAMIVLGLVLCGVVIAGIHLIDSLSELMGGWLGHNNFPDAWEEPFGGMNIQGSVIAGVAVVVPLMLALNAAIFLRRGRPGSVTVVDFFRRKTVTVVCVILLVYAAAVTATARFEQVANVPLNAMLTVGELQNYAQTIHKPWPGRVP